jgi:tol-pal system protein YbgF
MRGKVSRIAGGLLLMGQLSACGPSPVELLSKRVDELDRTLGDVKKQLATQTVLAQNLETDLFLYKDRLETVERNRARRARVAEELPAYRIKPESAPEIEFGDSVATPVVAARTDPGCDLPDTLTPDGRRVPGCKGGLAASAEPEPKVVASKRGGPSPSEAPKTDERVRPTAKASDRTAKDLYEAAMADYKAGRLDQATEAFLDFVQRFPAHEYSDNALYWAGECYYSRALWNKALELFTQVVESYPMENKTSDAMLKIGLCHVNLGNSRAARDAFTSVVDTFPDSPVANLARAKLSELQ